MNTVKRFKLTRIWKSGQGYGYRITGPRGFEVKGYSALPSVDAVKDSLAWPLERLNAHEAGHFNLRSMKVNL